MVMVYRLSGDSVQYLLMIACGNCKETKDEASFNLERSRSLLQSAIEYLEGPSVS
jgi:hypothetical protein